MYQNILSFLRRYLDTIHIQSQLLKLPLKAPIVFDGGLREYLFESPLYQEILQGLLDAYQTKTVYFLTDHYGCRYTLVYLPDNYCLLVGPYSYTRFQEPQIYHLAKLQGIPTDKLGGLKNYFFTLPFTEEEPFVLLLLTFADEVYGNSDSYSVDFISSPFDEQFLYGKFARRDLEKENLSDIEKRYELMGQIMKSVKVADTKQATLYLNQYLSKVPGRRFSNALKDAKNWLIVFNTSLRIVAESANIHPYHLHNLSEKFSFRIDALTDPNTKPRIMHDMIRQYCLLILSHTHSAYSGLIQKALIFVEANLADDLSLSTVANQLNVNASYLSNTFKTEIGTTFTEHVTRKRIQESLIYLNSTDLPVSVIAQKVGICDLSYFTKLFKKQIGSSPSDYRRFIRHP